MDDSVLRQVKQYARSRSISLSRAMQELVQQGLDPWPPGAHCGNGETHALPPAQGFSHGDLRPGERTGRRWDSPSITAGMKVWPL